MGGQGHGMSTHHTYCVYGVPRYIFCQVTGGTTDVADNQSINQSINTEYSVEYIDDLNRPFDLRLRVTCITMNITVQVLE